MKRNYLKMVRRTYRHLRHPRIRKIKWLTPYTKTLFLKRYWTPCRVTVANGLAIGLFCAMLLMPFQMVLAAIGCLRFRGNIPVALAACWLTNPLTQPLCIIFQYKLGQWMHTSIGLPRPPLLGKIEHSFDVPNLSIFEHTFLEKSMISINIADYLVGMIISAIVLALLAFPIVWGISMFLPNRGKATK